MIDNCFSYFKYIHHIHIITNCLKINNMNKQYMYINVCYLYLHHYIITKVIFNLKILRIYVTKKNSEIVIKILVNFYIHINFIL